MNINSAMSKTGFRQKLIQSIKNIFFDVFQNGGISNRELQTETEFCIQIFVTEKCKSYKINRRMCDVYGERWFSQKCLQIYRILVCHYEPELKRQWIGVVTHRFSGKIKVPGATINKKSHIDSLFRHVRTHHNWFPWKRYD